MKFLVSTTGYSYDEMQASMLKQLGFTFSIVSDRYEKYDKKEVEVVIRSLKELREFIDKYGQIIISHWSDEPLPPKWRIEIYDDYRE